MKNTENDKERPGFRVVFTHRQAQKSARGRWFQTSCSTPRGTTKRETLGLTYLSQFTPIWWSLINLKGGSSCNLGILQGFPIYLHVLPRYSAPSLSSVITKHGGLLRVFKQSGALLKPFIMLGYQAVCVEMGLVDEAT